jgi:hypothetical protein
MRLREAWVNGVPRFIRYLLRVVSKIPIAKWVSQKAESGLEMVSANGIRRSQGDADLSAQQTRSAPPSTRGVICSAYRPE